MTPYEGYVAVCEALNERTPGAGEKRSLLVNSGAEAVENAVKIARAATGRPAVVVFDQAFHGRTLLALSLTAKVSPYKRVFGPYAPEIYRVPFSYPFRGTGSLDESIAAIEALVDPAQVACVVVEPIAGEGGFVVPEPGWLAGIARWCRDHGALFVADEVQTGFGRTGAWFVCEHEGVEPDVIATAKGLGAGMPIGGHHGACRGDGRGAHRRPRRHLRRQPRVLRGRARVDRGDREGRTRRAGARARRGHDEAAAGDAGIGARRRRRARPRRDGRDGARRRRRPSRRGSSARVSLPHATRRAC